MNRPPWDVSRMSGLLVLVLIRENGGDGCSGGRKYHGDQFPNLSTIHINNSFKLCSVYTQETSGCIFFSPV